MIQFSNRFLAFWVSLNSFKDGASDEIRLQGDSARADKLFRQNLTLALNNLKQDCELLQMDSIVKRIDHFIITLNVPIHCTVIQAEIHAILCAVHTEAFALKFAFIPKNLEAFFEQEMLFGETVYNAFPTARPHIKDAGNCLASDLNTAAVYHFMITAELGLRALAKHVKVKLKGDLQYADWSQVIAGIDSKLDSIKLPRGKKRQAELEFYRSLSTACEEFKDVWRNNIMHARRRYNQLESLNVYTRVSDFMERLATRVSES